LNPTPSLPWAGFLLSKSGVRTAEAGLHFLFFPKKSPGPPGA
jgi:hypothetical protein